MIALVSVLVLGGLERTAQDPRVTHDDTHPHDPLTLEFEPTVLGEQCSLPDRLLAATFVIDSSPHLESGGEPFMRLALLAGILALTVVPIAAQTDAKATGFSSSFTEDLDRVWTGSEYWANRLQDWRVQDGRLECVSVPRLRMRTLHLLTHRLDSRSGAFSLSVTSGVIESSRGGADTSSRGFLIGAGGSKMDWRAAAVIHGFPGPGAGIYAGVDARGQAFLRDFAKAPPTPGSERGRQEAPEGEIILRLDGRPEKSGLYRLVIEAWDPRAGTILSRAEMPVDADRVVGNLALVYDPVPGAPARKFWFREWRAAGDKLAVDRQRGFGPVISSLYTLSRGTLRLTAQLAPLGKDDDDQVLLQVNRQGKWITVDESRLDRPSFNATFEVTDWDDAQDHAVRVAYVLRHRGGRVEPRVWTGQVRRDPKDNETIVVAAFTGNHNNSHDIGRGWGRKAKGPLSNWIDGMWFPHADLTQRVKKHEPDLLFFSGDQVYEGKSPTFADRKQIELDYLYKWYLWCWAWRDLTREIPGICLPDDHDVYQGNVWGEGGRKARSQESGGYVHPARFVKMVQRTQTSHLPVSSDPAPVEQDIGVYFTDLNWGGVGFAIIEDRKFKSGCADHGLPPSGTRRTDHFNDPEFDVEKLDLEGLKLLGDRQLAFLRGWAADWRGVEMKAALSQTVFANMATHHGAGLKYLVADLDSNGWPQSGRNRALAELRRGFACHIAGDQHLATVVHHGIDVHRDAIWSFCVPSVANFYPRKWMPALAGANRRDGAPAWMGDHRDGFRNLVTVHAVANPGIKTGRHPADLHDKMAGYGIVRFRKDKRLISFECWPRWADPGNPEHGQYEGWPQTIRQTDNYAPEPFGYLPLVVVAGMQDPVIQVIHEGRSEIVYTLRIQGDSFQPKVFEDGVYTLRVGELDTPEMIVRPGLKPNSVPGGTPMMLRFE